MVPVPHLNSAYSQVDRYKRNPVDELVSLSELVFFHIHLGIFHMVRAYQVGFTNQILTYTATCITQPNCFAAFIWALKVGLLYDRRGGSTAPHGVATCQGPRSEALQFLLLAQGEEFQVESRSMCSERMHLRGGCVRMAVVVPVQWHRSQPI